MAANDGDPINAQCSSSTSISETVKGSHRFTIHGYSLAKGMGPGKYIASDTFSVGGHDWAIYFYPDGKNPDDSSMHVSVFIALSGEGADVRALFEITLLDQSGKGKDKVHSHFDRTLEGGPYSLKCKGSMWGYKRFFRRTSLETSDYLKDDCLSLDCTVGVVRTRVEAPRLCRVPVPPSDMGQNLKHLLDSEIGCDIIFQVGKESFKAHKLILAARSPVFRAQFFGLFNHPNNKPVELEDIEPSAFKALLKYIYSDKLPGFCETSAIMMQNLLAASDRFGLDRLKQKCEAKLSEKVNVDMVATTLSLADQHNCIKLKDICLKFAATNLKVFMRSEGFKFLEQSCPTLLSELVETVATMDEKSKPSSRKKRSCSSTYGVDLAAEGVAEPVNSIYRRLRRRA